MNTNRGSYMLGAALGSALVLTLCVKAHAADIYEAPPAQVVEAPPPPPLDRGIYLKGYIGQANPDVGEHLGPRSTTATSTFICSTTTASRARTLYGLGIGWQHSHWLRFDRSRVEYRGDAIVRCAGPISRLFGAARTSTRPTSKSWLGLVNAYIDMGILVRLHAIRRCGHRLRHDLGERSEGRRHCRRSRMARSQHRSTATTTRPPTSPGRCYAGTSYDVTPASSHLDLSYRYANLGSRHGAA